MARNMEEQKAHAAWYQKSINMLGFLGRQIERGKIM
jgi:hypothetical protein